MPMKKRRPAAKPSQALRRNSSWLRIAHRAFESLEDRRMLAPLPTVSLATATQTVNEDGSTFTVTVNLSAASSVDTTVPFTLSGTAADGVNYSNLTASPIVIPAGQTSATITGTLTNDGQFLSTTQQQWDGYGANAQHTADSVVASQPLQSIHWQTVIDGGYTSTYGQYAHYGSPMITANNTVIAPERTTSGGWQIQAINGATGTLLWTQSSDYNNSSINYGWLPAYQPTIAGTGASTEVYYQGLGGTVYERGDLDTPGAVTPTQIVLPGYNAGTATAFDNNVVINTPLTADSAGDVYFGYTVANPAAVGGLQGGIAEIQAGTQTVTIQTAYGAAEPAAAPSMGVATAVGGSTANLVYFAMAGGDLMSFDTTNSLALVNSVAVPGGFEDLSTAAPTVGPDGNVYMGNLNPNPYDRGTMYQYSPNLTQTAFQAATPGGFGWDDTMSIVPLSMVPWYQPTDGSTYLLFSKYNGYASQGGGPNYVAILDPNAQQYDAVSGRYEMKVVAEIASPNGDEWCINSGVVDPQTDSVLVNNEDGHLYSWDLGGSAAAASSPAALTQSFELFNGSTTQPYTSTEIGPDGAVYASTQGQLYAIGALPPSSPSTTLTVTLGTPTNAALGDITSDTVTIDAQPTVSLADVTQMVNENGGTFSVTVNLSATSSHATTVPFTLGGTATGGVNYSGVTASPIVIPAGQTSATITGTLLDDGLYDPTNATLMVTLGTPTNAALGAITSDTVTIVESDPEPTVSLATATQTVNENGGAFSVTVNLSAASGVDTTVPFTLGGTAATGVNYSAVTASPIVIPAGQTSATITGTLLDDGLYMPTDATLIVTLDTPTNATLGTTTSDTLTIVESDPEPTVSLATATQTVNENGGTFSVTVNLSAASGVDTTVPFTLGGSAASGVNYSAVTASPIVIPAGQTSATITGTLLDDGLYMPTNATLIVTLDTPTNATLGTTTSDTLTIVESDPEPTVSLATATQTVNENGGTFSVTVNLSAASGVDTTVPFTLGGTAAGGLNYSNVTASPIVIPAGQTSATITGTLLDDGLYVPTNATLIVTLGTPTNATPGAITSDTVSIVESDPEPTVSLATATQTVDDIGGTFSVTVNLSAASGVDTTVPFTLGGTAASGVDYSGVTASPIVIPAGQTSATITGTLLDNGLYEPTNTTLTVTLGCADRRHAGRDHQRHGHDRQHQFALDRGHRSGAKSAQHGGRLDDDLVYARRSAGLP